MSETHSTTENNNSHCCDNTCGNADDRVVPDSVEINPLFARPEGSPGVLEIYHSTEG